jgi:hypothetical protein
MPASMLRRMMESLKTKRNALRAIVTGGLAAGVIDLAQAIFFFGPRVPRGIAAALVGRQIAHGGGAGIYALGVALHFFIATSFAAFYYAVSRRLPFLIEHPVVCGLAYGDAVEQVMSYVVLPLSALHARGPYTLHDVILGLGVHMITVGLPIAFSVRHFSR